MPRTGRPPLEDLYERKRDEVFSSVDRIFLEQRRRVLECDLQDPETRHHHYSMEELEARHRRLRLGPSLRPSEDTVVTIRGSLGERRVVVDAKLPVTKLLA